MSRNSATQNPEREAESIHAKASQAEFSRNYDQAFRLYIKSAEGFLHLSRSGNVTEKKKQQWKATAAKALERAEMIKKSFDVSRSRSTPQSPTPNVHLTPVGIDHFSHQEQQYVLKKGSNVNGLFFSLWDHPVSISRNATAYIDPDGQPTLSPEQQEASPVWRRPISVSSFSEPSQLRRRILPQEILQHIVTDCSVCASISVCLEHGRRFGSTLAESALRGFTETLGSSSIPYGRNGRHDVCILFNGAWRRIGNDTFSKIVPGMHLNFLVVIDDQLPFHPTDGTLMCMSILPTPSFAEEVQATKDTLWPSLLEKAYMKLMGGYEFPGSNSSIDLHALTGWIPEHIDIKRSGFERERSWERIVKGFSNGECMVTLGTGTKPYISWREVVLLPSHSYAVIEASETTDGRTLTFLDSWVRPETDNEHSRVLQIPWSEVLNTFDGIYLSWDPTLWPRTLTFHGMWKRNEGDQDGTRYVQLTFSNAASGDEEIWILLTRHVSDTRKSSDFVSLQVDVEEGFSSDADWRVNQLSLSSKGTYTNSTQVLNKVKVQSLQRSGILCISASYEGVGREVGFTLTAYAKQTTKLSWIEKQNIPPHTRRVESSFSSKSAGGNCTFPTFMVNPQYHLVIHPVKTNPAKANVTMTLQSSKDMPINVALVWSQGQRISELSQKNLAATSGAYSYGSARLMKSISPGEYTVVASAFEPQNMAPFTLKIDSSHPFDLKPIPHEGSGMYTKVVRGSWEGSSAAGAPSFNRYTQNPIFELDITSVTQLIIRLQLLHSSTSIALNVTVYPNMHDDVLASVTQNAHVLTSGAYDDAIAGVAPRQGTLGPGRYYIVPSTYNPGLEVAFRLIVYSSVPGIKLAPLGHSSESAVTPAIP